MKLIERTVTSYHVLDNLKVEYPVKDFPEIVEEIIMVKQEHIEFNHMD